MYVDIILIYEWDNPATFFQLGYLAVTSKAEVTEHTHVPAFFENLRQMAIEWNERRKTATDDEAYRFVKNKFEPRGNFF